MEKNITNSSIINWVLLFVIINLRITKGKIYEVKVVLGFYNSYIWLFNILHFKPQNVDNWIGFGRSFLKCRFFHESARHHLLKQARENRRGAVGAVLTESPLCIHKVWCTGGRSSPSVSFSAHRPEIEEQKELGEGVLFSTTETLQEWK